ncbi:hypothetical protein IX51_08450 [uncultured archaeon]|nr:hypothetical protein IX51_08450 [uncultured archaeon]
MSEIRYDLAVIGSGIVGLTSAFYIKKGNPDLKIVVIDKQHTFAQGQTGRSAAAFRDLFSSDTNYNLAASSIDFYSHIQKELGYDIGMRYTGYMFLLTEGNEKLPVLEELSKKTRTRTLGRDELENNGNIKLVPDRDVSEIMGLKEIVGGFIGLNCGIIEPDLLSKYYYEELIHMGVEFMFNTPVESISLEPFDKLDFPGEPFLWQKKTIGSLKTPRGDIVADTYVVATDVWSSELLDPIGIDCHIRPKKRQVFQVSGEEIEKMLFSSRFSESEIFPFTVLPSNSVYMRPAPREKSFWVGVADDIGRDFSFQDDPMAERRYYDYNIIQVIQSYIPAFSNSRVTGMWAGYYSYNTIDMNPYVFQTLNLIVATGTSGSGILKGDSVGRTVAALYNQEEYVNLTNNRKIKTSDLGVSERNVDRERFVL